MQKGTVNVAEVGTAACKSRAVLNVRADASVTGYHRYYGEEGQMHVCQAEVRLSKIKGCGALSTLYHLVITPMHPLNARYGRRRPGRKSIYWKDGSIDLFELSSLRVERYKLSWLRSPNFVATSLESPVGTERPTPGSEEGAPETAG